MIHLMELSAISFQLSATACRAAKLWSAAARCRFFPSQLAGGSVALNFSSAGAFRSAVF
jgi:hypothetical protein